MWQESPSEFRRLWKIHDLEKLCLTLKADKDITDTAGKLNPHYVETRYPLETAYTDDVAEEALENAEKVVGWVKEQLEKLKKCSGIQREDRKGIQGG